MYANGPACLQQCWHVVPDTQDHEAPHDVSDTYIKYMILFENYFVALKFYSTSNETE